MIKLYTKSVCPKCMLIKATLDNAGVEYETINIEENEEAKNKVVEAGFMAVPVMETDGELIGTLPEMQEVISKIAE